jgi:parallel beta-helix repeat protein
MKKSSCKNLNPYHSGVVIVLLLLLAISLSFIPPQSPIRSAKGNPSTLIVPSSQYPTIQSAINAAMQGDTILVSAGTYHENLVVTKTLNLVGASPANTIIDASASGAGINITAVSSVYVSGFTIKNTDIYNSGILVSASSNVTISGNIVIASAQTNGTYIVNSNSLTVKRNTFTGNLYGISILRGFGNLLQGNDVTGNRSGDIYIAASSGNRIVNNTVRASQSGLMLWNDAAGNVVARNLIANNTSEGIFLWNSLSAGNLFLENRIEFNRDAAMDTAGVNIQNSTLNRFYHNIFQNNSIPIFGVLNQGLTSNWWDNSTGLPLKTDPKIMFVDTNGNSRWDYNETVVYDTNNDGGTYDPLDTVITSIKGSPAPLSATLKTDPKIKFADANNDNVWERGEPVVYDSDTNNIFDPGEPAIAAVGGNYWRDYRGLDNGSHGFTGDGIGDTLIPTPCPNGGRPCSVSGPAGVDWYPLMTPWRPSNLNITISAKPLGGYPPLQISFTSSTNGGIAPYTYSWNFGDGSVSTQQNTTHTYSAKGNYIATLTVTDASTATGSNVIPITVLSPIGNLALQVLDEAMKPISGANVSLIITPPGQQRLSMLTNNHGNTTFAGIAVGSYLAQASSLGYQTATKNVTIAPGQTTSTQLVLTKVAAPNSFPWALLGVGVAAAFGAVAVFLVLKRRKRRSSRVRG